MTYPKSIFAFAVLLLLFSCEKKTFKSAEWIAGDFPGYLDPSSVTPLDSATQAYYDGIFEDGKILRVSSFSELETLEDYNPYKSVENSSITNSSLGQIDFNNKVLYVILMNYQSQEEFKICKDDIKINESTQSIEFDFKMKVPVGGSGMGSFSTFFYFIFPKEQETYNFSGKFKVNESSSNVGSAHDYTREFSLP